MELMNFILPLYWLPEIKSEDPDLHYHVSPQALNSPVPHRPAGTDQVHKEKINWNMDLAHWWLLLCIYQVQTTGLRNKPTSVTGEQNVEEILLFPASLDKLKPEPEIWWKPEEKSLESKWHNLGGFIYPLDASGHSQVPSDSTKCEEINKDVYKISLWRGFGFLMPIPGCSTHLGISVLWVLMHLAPINHQRVTYVERAHKDTIKST